MSLPHTQPCHTDIYLGKRKHVCTQRLVPKCSHSCILSPLAATHKSNSGRMDKSIPRNGLRTEKTTHRLGIQQHTHQPQQLCERSLSKEHTACFALCAVQAVQATGLWHSRSVVALGMLLRGHRWVASGWDKGCQMIQRQLELRGKFITLVAVSISPVCSR